MTLALLLAFASLGLCLCSLFTIHARDNTGWVVCIVGSLSALAASMAVAAGAGAGTVFLCAMLGIASASVLADL